MVTISADTPDVELQRLIDSAHEARHREEERRYHMGCSMIGHHCERWVWLSFRWAIREQFPGRLLRLFRRGHNEEDTVIDDLRAAGLVVSATQPRVDLGCHVSGSLDGIIESGVPGAEKTRHVLEIKTHNLASFGPKWSEDSGKPRPKSGVCWQGVKQAKPQHWAQMQLYMHGTGIKRALYVAVCKDDDRMYVERVRFNAAAATELKILAQGLALSDRMPEPMRGGSATWYQCKWCPAHGFCWGGQDMIEKNCRTCAHSSSKSNSTFSCRAHEDETIPNEFQPKGCDGHEKHHGMAPWVSNRDRNE